MIIRMTGHKLERETGALGKSQEHDPLRRKSSPGQVIEYICNCPKPGGEARFVLEDRCQKTVGIPRIPRSLRRDISILFSHIWTTS